MYCVYGESRSFLLIESTDSIIKCMIKSISALVLVHSREVVCFSEGPLREFHSIPRQKGERSFSLLRHIKTYLRTLRQDKLNHLMMLYIHKERNVSITDAMKEFVLSNDKRKCIFGNI